MADAMDVDAPEMAHNEAPTCPPHSAAPIADALPSPQATATEQLEEDVQAKGGHELEISNRSRKDDLVVSLTRRGEQGTQRLVEAAEGVLSTLNLVMCNGAFWEASSETAGSSAHGEQQQQQQASGLPPDAAAAAIEMAHLRYKNISSELRSLLLRLQEETEKAGRSEDEREENQGGEKQRASLGPESESAAPDTAPDRAAPEAAPGNAPEAPPEPSADAAPPSAEELTKRAATLRKHIRRCNVRLRAAMEALRGMLDDVTMFQAPQLLLLSQS